MRETESVSSCCRIALLGFGTVGSAVARRLTTPEPGAPSNIQLTHIFDRRAGEKRGSLRAGGVTWTSSIDQVLQSGADVVVEAIGGVEPAAGWIRAALLAGKSVVTANKQVVACEGASLLKLAASQGRQLRFEAAVGGAMPIVRAIGEGLAGDRITRLVAILNGTTNAVLSQMEATGCALDTAVRDARARGYAEADPSADLDGHDARAKLAILCALAFGLRVDPLQIETRTSAAIWPEAFLARLRRSGAASAWSTECIADKLARDHDHKPFPSPADLWRRVRHGPLRVGVDAVRREGTSRAPVHGHRAVHRRGVESCGRQGRGARRSTGCHPYNPSARDRAGRGVRA